MAIGWKRGKEKSRNFRILKDKRELQKIMGLTITLLPAKYRNKQPCYISGL